MRCSVRGGSYGGRMGAVSQMNRNISTLTPAQLRRWIEHRYDTQAQACEGLGVAQRTLTAWLSGQTAPPLMLERLIRAIELGETRT